ncbi:hypothetical protein AVEN_60930-1 [Araneus ventricosus]|uniref:Uncharacterized protein n=1 Tax=Araneus ventricosus TaxID=182803 RepID=A0A4Y2M6E6_ARAVE|nr:hypothetical protein AVEN_32459-1 [Araneus ventricosus]GBN21294.1 hypothetical protein AVEN_60930-1 [Araneus ventricosus]
MWERPSFSIKDKGNSLSPSKTTMAAGIVRIVRKLPSSPNTSGRAILTKKACTACVKSITLNERGWKCQSDIRTFRTAIVFCLKGRMRRYRIDRVKQCSRPEVEEISKDAP